MHMRGSRIEMIYWFFFLMYGGRTHTKKTGSIQYNKNEGYLLEIFKDEVFLTKLCLYIQRQSPVKSPDIKTLK